MSGIILLTSAVIPRFVESLFDSWNHYSTLGIVPHPVESLLTSWNDSPVRGIVPQLVELFLCRIMPFMKMNSRLVAIKQDRQIFKYNFLFLYFCFFQVNLYVDKKNKER